MQRDWILRVIEQMGAVLAELRRMLFGGQPLDAAALERLDHLVSQVGLSTDVARTASADTLLLMVAPTGEVDPTRAWVLAEALYIDGLDAELRNDPDRADNSFRKALLLYRLVEPGSAFTGLVEATARISEVERRLSPGEQGQFRGRADPDWEG